MSKYIYFFTKEELKEQKKKEAAKKKLLKNSITKHIAGVKITIGLASKVLSEDESADVLSQNTNSEVQIVIRNSGAMYFTRRKGSTVNLFYVAALFNGAGCQTKALATYPRRVNSKNFREIAEEIFYKLVALEGGE